MYIIFFYFLIDNDKSWFDSCLYPYHNQQIRLKELKDDALFALPNFTQF